MIAEKRERLGQLKQNFDHVKEKFTNERKKELNSYMDIFMLFVKTLRKDQDTDRGNDTKIDT